MQAAKETVMLKYLAPGCAEVQISRAFEAANTKAPPLMGVRHYRRQELEPQQGCAGVRHWGVALDKAMLTYFEVDPNTRFALHRHATEQITLVLEGTLFFELDGVVTEINHGEVLAVPPGVPHSAFTRDAAVKAVDAWSPSVKEFLRTASGVEGGHLPPRYEQAARPRLW